MVETKCPKCNSVNVTWMGNDADLKCEDCGLLFEYSTSQNWSDIQHG